MWYDQQNKMIYDILQFYIVIYTMELKMTLRVYLTPLNYFIILLSFFMQAEILAKNFEDAQKYCDECLKIAEKLGQPNLIKTAKQCGKDVKEVQARENEQKKSGAQVSLAKTVTKSFFFLFLFIIIFINKEL